MALLLNNKLNELKKNENETLTEDYCILTVRNFCFQVHGGSPHKETINMNQKLGDWIVNLRNFDPYMNIKSFFIITNSREKKYFGYDLNLSSKFSDYLYFKGEITVHTHHLLDWPGTQYNILHPLAYFKHNENWPPVELDDWKNGEPINLAPYLIWNGYGSGPVEVDEKLDNCFKNLVILQYPNNVKKIVNSYSYLMSIVSTDKKDALTNKKIKTSMVSKLLEAINIQRYKCKNFNYENVLLPVVDVEFDE